MSDRVGSDIQLVVGVKERSIEMLGKEHAYQDKTENAAPFSLRSGHSHCFPSRGRQIKNATLVSEREQPKANRRTELKQLELSDLR